MLSIGENDLSGQGLQESQNADSEGKTKVTFIPEDEASDSTSNKPDLSVKKGEMCFNHPWRQAYAKCSICKRPFCYADLLEHNGKEYCLEDLSQASHIKNKATSRPNGFAYISSALFFATSLLLLYYIYPQALFLSGEMQRIGIFPFILHYSYVNYIIIISIVFSLLGFLFGIVVLFPSLLKLVASILMLVVMSLFFSYVYLSTGSTVTSNYLLYVIMMLLVNLLALTLSAFGYEGRLAQEAHNEKLDWPRLETF